MQQPFSNKKPAALKAKFRREIAQNLKIVKSMKRGSTGCTKKKQKGKPSKSKRGERQVCPNVQVRPSNCHYHLSCNSTKADNQTVHLKMDPLNDRGSQQDESADNDVPTLSQQGRGRKKRMTRSEIGFKPSEAGGQAKGPGHSEIKPKSIPLRLPPLKPNFYDSLTRGLKKQIAAKIKNAYLNGLEWSESSIYTGPSQQRNPRNWEPLSYQEDRRAVNPNPQPKRQMREQELIQTKKQSEIKIQKYEEEKKRLQEKIEIVDKKNKELGKIFDKIDEGYKQAFKIKDPSVKIFLRQRKKCINSLKQWGQRRRKLWNKLDILNKQIRLEDQKFSQLQDYLFQLDYQDQQPQKEPVRSAAFEHEQMAQITQKELIEIEQCSIKEQVQGQFKQKAQLEKQISDLEAELQKAEANNIEKKGLEDLLKDKASQLFELRQKTEALEGKLQES